MAVGCSLLSTSRPVSPTGLCINRLSRPFCVSTLPP